MKTVDGIAVEDNQTLETPVEITKKQRVLDARGHEVTVDYFLYSCLEQERLERAKKDSKEHAIKWPVLGAPGTEEGAVAPAAVSAAELGDLLCQLFAWYRDNFAALTSKRALDHEQLIEVAPPFVALCRDLADLHKQKTGSYLPPFPTTEGEPAAVWTEINASLASCFPTHQHLFKRYLQWTYATEKTEEFIPGSRPPIGRFAPPHLPRTGPGRDSGRSGPGRDSGGRGGRPERGPVRGRGPDKGPDQDRDGQGDKEERPRAPRPQASTSSAEGSDRRPQQGQRKPQGDQARRRRGPENEEQTTRLKEKALAEVVQAISTMKTDSSVSEVALNPTNSFYRRIQHQEIVDAGFVSNSVGEGSERAVKISRKD